MAKLGLCYMTSLVLVARVVHAKMRYMKLGQVCHKPWKRQAKIKCGMLSRMTEAWRSEFWPPAAAESALALVSVLARKCAWLSVGVPRRQFAIAVPGVSLPTTANELCAANTPSICRCDIPAVFRGACIKECSAHFVLAFSITRAKHEYCLVARLPSGLLDSNSGIIPVGSPQEAALPNNTAGKDS